MGRNMNLLVGVASAGAAAAIALPGGGVAPAGAEASQGPVAAPEIFNECAQLAIAATPDAVISTEFQVAAAEPNEADISVNRRIRWDGPLTTADGTQCPGNVRLSSSLERKARGFIQRITGKIALGVGADVKKFPVSVSGQDRDISLGKICAAATVGGTRPAKAKVVAVDKRTYTAPGYPAVTNTDETVLASAQCPTGDQ